jgi:hypothetical protein
MANDTRLLLQYDKLWGPRQINEQAVDEDDVISKCSVVWRPL